MMRFKSSFLCSLFTSSCSFHFLCTLSSYANRKNAYRIRLSHLDSQFVATIRSGNFERRLKIKMGRIVLKWKTARGANVFFGKFALSKIDSTRVSETAFQFERKAHPLRSRCIEFVSIRPIECYLYVRVYRAGIGTNKSEIGSLWRNVWLLKRFDPLHSRIEFAFNRSTLSVDEEDGSLVSITSWNVSRGVKQRPRGDALSLSSYSRETIDFRSIAVITAMSATQSQ